MVREQFEVRGIHDARVLQAMERVPRHAFVARDQWDVAYDDRPLPIGLGQTISQPYMVALMTELLGPGPGDKVLEIGTGSGYQAAVLAEMGSEVVTLERHPKLAERASAKLAELGYAQVRVFRADGTRGWPDEAPYSRIIVTAGSPEVPEELGAQLEEGGRLVCPVGPRERQVLIRVERRGAKLVREEGIGCVFVPLIGEGGWPD